MSRFECTVEASLLDSGWFPERQVDAAEAIVTLLDAGYRVSKFAHDFLAEFDGLHFRFPNPVSPSRSIGYLLGSAMNFGFLMHGWVSNWSRAAREELCPVGTDDEGYGTFLIGGKGGVYEAFDDSLSWLGASLVEGMSALLRPERVRIPVSRSIDPGRDDG